ncbi:MAG: response regulator [Candidatus Marinimicrobia bacterium]|nr:response regulator [Candidatus Neomarinimicrobiota bacterium]
MTKNESSNKTILIVDDEALILELYSDFFIQKDYKVITAMNLREALNVLKENRVDIELILADVMLPDGKGFAIYDEVEKGNFEIPIIFMTGFKYKPEIQEKLKEIDTHWIAKPIKMEQLFEMVNDIFQNSKNTKK